jgi:serine/threonine protein kinase
LYRYAGVCLLCMLCGGMPFDDPLTAQQQAPPGRPLPDSFFSSRLERCLKAAAATVTKAGGGGVGKRGREWVPSPDAVTSLLRDMLRVDPAGRPSPAALVSHPVGLSQLECS